MAHGLLNEGVSHALKRQRYAELASVVLGVALLHESARVVLDRPWPPFVPVASHTVSSLYVLLWGATAAALLNRRRSRLAITLSWPLSLLSVLGFATHGVFIVSFSRQPIVGSAHFVAAALLGFLVKRAFDRGLLRHGRELDPRRV